MNDRNKNTEELEDEAPRKFGWRSFLKRHKETIVIVVALSSLVGSTWSTVVTAIIKDDRETQTIENNRAAIQAINDKVGNIEKRVYELEKGQARYDEILPRIEEKVNDIDDKFDKAVENINKKLDKR